MAQQLSAHMKPLYGKVMLKGKIECITGMHIGGARDTLEIGGIDAPVLIDPATECPYIPGSSLKGKMRSLLERQKRKPFNRNAGSRGNPIWQHVCENETKAYSCPVCRIFGSSGKSGADGNFPARLSVRDCKFTGTNDDSTTEVKFENSLDRITAAANPRQIERVTAGAVFDMGLVYDVETQDVNGQLDTSLNHVKEDLENILMLLSVIEADSIGGHGSRGYGRVGFQIDEFKGYTISYYGLSASDTNRDSFACGIDRGGSIDDCRDKISEIVEMFKREAST